MIWNKKHYHGCQLVEMFEEILAEISHSQHACQSAMPEILLIRFSLALNSNDLLDQLGGNRDSDLSAQVEQKSPLHLSHWILSVNCLRLQNIRRSSS